MKLTPEDLEDVAVALTKIKVRAGSSSRLHSDTAESCADDLQAILRHAEDALSILRKARNTDDPEPSTP